MRVRYLFTLSMKTMSAVYCFHCFEQQSQDELVVKVLIGKIVVKVGGKILKLSFKDEKMNNTSVHISRTNARRTSSLHEIQETTDFLAEYILSGSVAMKGI